METHTYYFVISFERRFGKLWTSLLTQYSYFLRSVGTNSISIIYLLNPISLEVGMVFWEHVSCASNDYSPHITFAALAGHVMAWACVHGCWSKSGSREKTLFYYLGHAKNVEVKWDGNLVKLNCTTVVARQLEGMFLFASSWVQYPLWQ